jgi:uncharacterized integral membrane protein
MTRVLVAGALLLAILAVLAFLTFGDTVEDLTAARRAEAEADKATAEALGDVARVNARTLQTQAAVELAEAEAQLAKAKAERDRARVQVVTIYAALVGAGALLLLSVVVAVQTLRALAVDGRRGVLSWPGQVVDVGAVLALGDEGRTWVPVDLRRRESLEVKR